MEYVIILVIVVIVGFLIWFYLKDRDKPKPSKTVTKDFEYAEFLSVMETVFKGGDKLAQERFLLKEFDRIKKFSFWTDFVRKFKAIKQKYGK